MKIKYQVWGYNTNRKDFSLDYGEYEDLKIAIAIADHHAPATVDLLKYDEDGDICNVSFVYRSSEQFKTNTMLYIHKSELPKKVQSELKQEPDWLEGSVLFTEHSTKADFLNKQGKVLFRFSRPVVMMQSERLIRYAASVFTGIDKKGVMIGEFCELTFHFLPIQTTN